MQRQAHKSSLIKQDFLFQEKKIHQCDVIFQLDIELLINFYVLFLIELL